MIVYILEILEFFRIFSWKTDSYAILFLYLDFIP